MEWNIPIEGLEILSLESFPAREKETPMLRKFGNAIAIAVGVIVLFFAILFIALSIFNSPAYAWRILRYGQSDIGDVDIFPERAILNGENVSFLQKGHEGTPYEVEYPYVDGMRTELLDQLLKRTDTRAFLIIKDDRLIYETYLESSRKEVNTSFSAAKSFNSALIVVAVAEGKIRSVDEAVI